MYGSKALGDLYELNMVMLHMAFSGYKIIPFSRALGASTQCPAPFH